MQKSTLKNILFICLIIFGFTLKISAQTEVIPDSTVNISQEEEKRGYFRIMFYNCENYYDTQNDPNINDEPFLPEGDHHWTPDKYWVKVKQIAKVITAVGGWDPPAIVGFCEIENRKVLEDLVKNSPLSLLNYSIVHYDSPDARGIDVALIYRKEDFIPIVTRPVPVKFPDGKKSRDILYVKGVTSKNDTLHVFVNHWPSKFGGSMESEPRRLFVGNFLKEKCDSIINSNFLANIVIIGDMNDNPQDKSVSEALKAKITYDYFSGNELYNLTNYIKEKYGGGSLKFQGEWDLIDNIIVSGSMLNMKNKVYTTLEDAHIFKASFLMEKDERNFGFKPSRTYIGMTYHGGFSDHLPVYLDLRENKLKK